MPDLEGALPLILLMIFLWVRSIGAAMKRNRQRQEEALAQAQGGEAVSAEGPPDAEAAGREDRPLELPGMPNLPPDAGVATTAPAKRPSLREQLRDMGRQLEQQMQQAAEEGRPGSLVGHVEPGEEPETPGMLRPQRPTPASLRRPAPAPASLEAPETRNPSRRASPSRGAQPARPPVPTVGGGLSTREGPQPLERLDRYDPLSRAVILSEILRPPPGLSGDRES